MTDYFLGLDCSTQSLTAVLIDDNSIFYKQSINFDDDLPHYVTQNGTLIFDDPKIVHSYPLMWVESLDLLFEKFIQDEISTESIKIISGSAQQHGTVYLNDKFERVLHNLNPDKPLVKQLEHTFSRKTSPIWMDSSTTIQCNEIREQLGGMEAIIKITGSNAFERFSGPQIRKFYQDNLEAYNNTSIIHLVSSFMASILLGKNAPIDHGDGTGMNLMNITTKQWDERALNATAPNLYQKLPPLFNSNHIIGKISPYFVMKYGFNPKTLLVAWSGDNPNSLIGVGITEKGKVAISLGTSDTYFAYMKNLALDLTGEGHVFSAPIGGYMSLICYKNGSLAREKVKNRFNLNWDKFSKIIRETPPGNYGKIMLPYFFPEIVPYVSNRKVYRFGFDENDLEGNVRAIIEAQFLSMKLHSEWIGEKPNEIYATGGASANIDILQVAANIFNTPIRRFEITDSAALGAAFRSAKSYYELYDSKNNWENIISNILNLHESDIIKPYEKYRGLYDDMLKLYRKYEEFVLRNGEDPKPIRKKFIDKYFSSYI
ncbi:MAG: xylulokinase [Promethearchaeota archaeon]